MAKSNKKKYDYRLREVQEAGNNLLRTTINSLRLTLTDISWISRSEEDQNDKGIDFEYELEDKNTGDTITIFKIQNKGTESCINLLKRTIHKGYISFQLKLRHAIYYRYQIPLTLIFTICDVRENKVYWYSVQLDDEIDERIENAKKTNKDSVQIYINPSNVLNYETVNKFFKDVKESYNQQTERHKVYAASLNHLQIEETKYSFNKSQPIIDQIYNYFTHLFNEVNVLPIHLLKNTYPFKSADDYNPDYSLFTLSTDNDELFELFESLKIENGNVYTTNNKFESGVEDSSKKLNYILAKLSEHLIFKIQRHNSHKKAEIRYSYEIKCSCLRCSFSKLNYEATFNGLLKTPKKNEGSMLLAYMHYELGNFVESAKQFEEIAKKQKKNKNIIQYAIAQFNLSKLYVLISINYWRETAQTEITERLKAIDTDKLYCNLKTDQNNKLLDWILNSDFYTLKREEINRTVNKLRDHYHIQLKGGWSSNNHISSLINDYAELEIFLKGNFIVYDKFSEYQELTDNFIEGLIISHAMDENQSSKLNYFDDRLFMTIVFNGSAERILKIFYRYELKTLKYKPASKNGDSFLDIVNNHLTNYQNVFSAFNKSCEKSNSVFWDKYNSIFCNLILLVSISEIELSQIKTISQNLLKYLKETNFINHISIKYIRLFIDRKGELIEKKDLHGFLDVFIANGKFHHHNLIETVTSQIKKNYGVLDIDRNTLDELLLIAFGKCKLCNRYHQPEFIASIYYATKSEFKVEIKNRIIDVLKIRFSSDLYYMSSIYGVFNGEDEFFDLFVESAKSNSKTSSFRSIFSGIEDNRLPQVNMLLNLCYKNGIDLSQNKFDYFRSLNDYFLWLFNMEHFDYNKFNPKWVKEYQTIYYFEQFRKFPEIKEKVLEYLKENSDFLLEAITIKQLT
ncbi:DUF4365 domain-containing protein [Flavobacterium filum]|uniref:DUF4365 domain-containing protein n=1 Tax=Flavobacterium filum TaxID=370974 RepID=UPI0023EFB2B7|nr:DUF4365 domain-containing protein [Flavobacterium filum]